MRRLILYLLVSTGLFAAIPSDSVWEIQITGSDSNCGGFSVANKGATGVDLTYPTSTPATFTSTLSATGTTTLTDSANGFTNLMLGNCVNVSGQGSYFITAFASSSAVTVDRTLGTFSTTSGVAGGALASLGSVCLAGNISTGALASNLVYLKAGSYSITTASTCVSGGGFKKGGGNGLVGVSIRGYTSTRDDYGGTRPVLTIAAATSGVTIIDSDAANTGFLNVSYVALNCGSNTTSKGITTFGGMLYNNTVANCTNTAIANGGTAIYNTVTGSSTQPALSGSGNFLFNEAYSNTVTAFSGGQGQYVGNIASGNSGASSDGFDIENTGKQMFSGNVAYANGRDGFRLGAGIIDNTGVVNNIATDNAGYGFNGLGSGGLSILLLNNATYNNTLGATNNFNSLAVLNPITLSASPFVNAASGNFALNNIAGAGAAVRAAGFPSTFPRGLTSSYRDVGAAQHQDTGGGSFVAVQ